MKIFNFKSIVVFLLGITGLFLLIHVTNRTTIEDNRIERIRSTSSPKASMKMKKGRTEYFFRLMRDPATNRIPAGIRQKELAFAKEQNRKNKSLKKSTGVAELVWTEAGPNDVGGRTRALAVDINDPNTIIAGGVSGGIWKSTDKGQTWSMKSTTTQVLSVNSIAQDPREGQTNTWYYATGELDGNSASDRSQAAGFTGGGIYKSTDNGETWNLLPSTVDPDLTIFNSKFDYVSRIVVHPITGDVYAASTAFGVLKSTDGGASFNVVLGEINDHKYVDVLVTGDGTLIATLSSGWNASPANQPGIYKSTNNGQQWTNITPNTYPAYVERSVIAIAPSNNDIVYVMSFTGQQIDQKYDDVRFHKITISTGASEDRSANMPNFQQNFEDYLNTQQNYNMIMAVKPDDENFVVIGATSLFRSTDGFSTKPADIKQNWIGGYNLQTFFYPNFHPDVHSFAFDPTNPNAMWWGHDGGLSYTEDIRNSSYTDFFPWEDKNNGYNVTQFYMIAIDDAAGDSRILGGTQDNGSPFFRYDGSSTTASVDVSTGDGAYAYIGDSFVYTSSQNGAVLRVDYDGSGNASRENGWSYIAPKDVTGQLFINPYAVDPNDENIMLYPAGNALWRNNSLNTLPYNSTFASGITEGWTQLTNMTLPTGYNFSTMIMSINNPAHRLYYGASNNSAAPLLYRFDNANTATTGAVELTVTGAAVGSYLHHIAVNPDNGDEILVILSNYNIVGIYHSTDGGQSFTAVEGNLEGNSNNPGPSIRSAIILPTNDGLLYMVATSTGIYSTTQLDGNQTNWTHEAADVVGNVVVNYLASRKSDGRIVAGTHGRGAFMSEAGTSGVPVAEVDVQQLTLQSKPGESGSTSFNLQNTGTAAMNYNVSVTGTFSNSLPKIGKTEYVLNSMNTHNEPKHKPFHQSIGSSISKQPQSILFKNDYNLTSSHELEGVDVLILDDGNESPDSFLGFGDGNDFSWLNNFNLSGIDFQLEAFTFYMKSESAFSNDVYVYIYNQNDSLLASGYLNLDLSEEGTWYTVNLNPFINFNDGESFYIIIEPSFSFINYPAGADQNASVTGNSYYYDYVSGTWVNLTNVSGWENGAFLIRAIGTIGGSSENQDPVAVAQLSKTQAKVDESITFDASQSYDNDGQITQYSWVFGDGETSDQKSVNHSYSTANTYNYSLTVTDNEGATGTITGQIIINEQSTELVTADPSSGTIPAGGSQTINLVLDAQNLQEGTYVGQVNITSNGGNLTIPIDLLVNVEDDNLIPTEFSLSQNYPNPFNPSTTIEYFIAKPSVVSLKVYDILGREVSILVDEKKVAGQYKVKFLASGLASGLYVYRLQTEYFTEMKKLVVMK